MHFVAPQPILMGQGIGMMDSISPCGDNFEQGRISRWSSGTQDQPAKYEQHDRDDAF